MKIAIVGKNGFGGREHTIADTIHRQNPRTELFLFPGNGGTVELGENLAADSITSIVDECKRREIDLLIGGPEADLDEGLADLSRSKGITTFGPSQAGARLESEKLFTKEVMEIFKVPTASYQFFPYSEISQIPSFLNERGFPAVIKANGLAAGKGVLVLKGEEGDFAAAEKFVADLGSGAYGGSGRSGVLVEKFLAGEEASLFYLVNSNNDILIPMSSARDHKRAYDGDRGPNTGGMGAFSENPLLDDQRVTEITQTIARPVVEGLKRLGIPYIGVLYVGLMLEDEKSSVVEINCRFGDPEIQVLAPRLKSNLQETLCAVAMGENPGPLEWISNQCVGVVLASDGYPGSYERGKLISGLKSLPEELCLFHAGTRRMGEDVYTSGGRVLNLVGTGTDLQQARKKVYDFLDSEKLYFEGMMYRSDIAKGI
jgi:phosphoribosylamine---glycine ligase